MSDQFPDNVFAVLQERLITLPGVSGVLLRPLEPTDANGSIGLVFESWQPVEYEIGGGGPGISEYTIQIEHLVKNADRASGNKDHRSVARNVRTMLYHDEGTVVALRQLTSSVGGTTERLLRWEIFQSFAANDVKQSFYFLSVTTVKFTTSIP